MNIAYMQNLGVFIGCHKWELYILKKDFSQILFNHRGKREIVKWRVNRKTSELEVITFAAAKYYKETYKIGQELTIAAEEQISKIPKDFSN